MKKRFTLMLVAMLVAMTSFAQPVKKSAVQAQLQQRGVERVLTHRPAQQLTVKPAANIGRMHKAARKAISIADLMAGPLEGMALNNFYTYDEESGDFVPAQPARGGAKTTVTLTSATEATILGLWESSAVAVNATFDAATLTFSIPDGQTIYQDDTYGTIVLKNAEADAPLTGSISEEGLTINELWYALATAGSYAGEAFSDYTLTAAIVPVNGTMAWTQGTTPYTCNVYILQDKESYVTTVFNYADMGTAFDINMKEDGKFTMNGGYAFYSGGYDFYLYGFGDVEGNSSAPLEGTGTETVLTLTTPAWSFYSPAGQWYGANTATSITLTDGTTFEYPVIEDKAVMPADPSVVEIGPYKASSGYGYVLMDIPNRDINGDLVKEDKLFYVLYSDIDGVVAPITFTAELYKNLEADLTEVPYTLNDGYDFDIDGSNKVIYMNFDFSEYDRIGVQSIYRGGDAENKTEIIWLDMPETVQTESIKWVAAEQGYSTTSEAIESIDFGAGISATLDKGTSTTQPTYYENGKALRFYAGNTMTITSDGPNIVKIIFEMGNTTTNITADTGNLTVDGTTVTWEGSATEVTFNGPSAKHARIVSMEIFYEAGEEPAPELVTLPDGAEPVEYLFTETYTTQDEETGEDVEEEYTKHAFVAVVGDQVYFQGLSDYVPEGWVVGTLEEGVITIPTGEYLGVYERYIEGMGYVDFDVFSNEIHFTYDAEADKYNAGAMSFAVNYSGSTITNEEYGSVELTRIVEKDAVPQAPEVVVVVDLAGEYPYIVLNVPTQDVNGDEMLTSKLSYGIAIEDNAGNVQTYFFTPEDYQNLESEMSKVPYLFNDGYDIFTGGNPVYVYAEDFTQWAAIWVESYYSGNTSEKTRYDLTEYWTGIDDVAAATDGAVKAVKYYDLQGRPATGATRGIVVAVKTMADGSTKTQKVLRK